MPWPSRDYGHFYNGDSYIVLETREAEEVDGIKPDKLVHRIFFWLGLYTSIDAQGTAAYKTVELDDLFDGYGLALGSKQGAITMKGNAFLAEKYPKVDYIKTARIK